MSKRNALVAFIKVAGPAFGLIRTQLPRLLTYLEEHPEVKDQILGMVSRLAPAGSLGASPAALMRQVEVLREQVSYLNASADSPWEADIAADLGRRLDNVEHSIRTVDVLTGRQRRRRLRSIRDYLTGLTDQILARFINESVEDSELGDERGRGAIEP
ncbi:MAG: DUF6474 family protein [Bowdeniella nasicola]|nr:DUF6474 family protein [Bowdeniella nasicola]